MRFMRSMGDPDHVEVYYFAAMHLSDDRVECRVWASSLDSFEWAWGPATWVCPD